MADSDEDECMIVDVKEPAIDWYQLKRPKIEAEAQPSPQVATPSSSATPSSARIQLDPNVIVKEELEYFPTALSKTNLVCIARLLANQLEEQAQPAEAQTGELQAQIAALTTQLKDQSINWTKQLGKKEAEFQRERISRQLADERAEERVKAMKVRLDETNRHRQATNLAHQTQRVELERVTCELQLVKETNVALATKKMEWQDKITQLEL
jgi:hypothetical protein